MSHYRLLATPWCSKYHESRLGADKMTNNLFHNAKIVEEKIAQPPHAGFHSILKIKDFLAGTSVEGWTYHAKLFSCDFLCAFAKNGSKNRNNLPVKVVAMYNWSNLNMTRHIEPKKNVFGDFFLQKHRENHRKRTLNEKFNPLHFFQLKNLLDPGLI